jgi:hypothetical protein
MSLARFAATVFLIFGNVGAVAQPLPLPPPTTAPPTAPLIPAVRPRPATAKPLLPPTIAILALVRSTLVAVDLGNKTGNYTVLRDLAAPEFRDANSPAQLGRIFANLVAQRIDLLAVTVVEPTYKTPPVITPKNLLYIVGSYTIRPHPIDFELIYQMDQGRWRLYGILIRPAAG